VEKKFGEVRPGETVANSNISIPVYDTHSIVTEGDTVASQPVPCEISQVQVKVKFTMEQATKGYRGSRGFALLFL
jgi:hypothetical protein